jgi:hypothetical protein
MRAASTTRGFPPWCCTDEALIFNFAWAGFLGTLFEMSWTFGFGLLSVTLPRGWTYSVIFVGTKVMMKTRGTYNGLRDPVVLVFDSHREGKTNHLLILCDHVNNDASNKDTPCSPGCDHAAGQVGQWVRA